MGDLCTFISSLYIIANYFSIQTTDYFVFMSMHVLVLSHCCTIITEEDVHITLDILSLENMSVALALLTNARYLSAYTNKYQ